MMSELIIEDYELQDIDPGPGAWTPVGKDDPTYTESFSDKVKVKNTGGTLTKVLNGLSWVINSGCTLSGFNFVSGAGSFLLGDQAANKNKAEGLFILNKDNSGICIGSFFKAPSTTVPCTCTFKFDSTPQDKVKG